MSIRTSVSLCLATIFFSQNLWAIQKGVDGTVDYQITNGQTGLELTVNVGFDVVGLGDINDDGYEDYAVSDPSTKSSTGVAIGSVMVMHGTANMQPGSNYQWLDYGAITGFGYALAASDVNGDGHKDLIVSYPYDPSTGGPTGSSPRVWVFYTGVAASGDAFGIKPLVPSSVFTGSTGSLSGYSIANAGDINGDGYEDVINGAPLAEQGGQTDEGLAFVWFGSATGLNGGAQQILQINVAGLAFGTVVTGIGDLNGDGYDDVAVSAPTYNSSAGLVCIYYGNANAATTNLTSPGCYSGTVANQLFGQSISGAGDVNDDGYDDFVIGSPGFSNTEANEGTATLILGSSSGPVVSSWHYESNIVNDKFGSKLTKVEDDNNDGFGDFAISTKSVSSVANIKVHIFRGGSAGPSNTPNISITNSGNNLEFGRALASGGDMNNDGLNDLLIGGKGEGYYFLGGEDVDNDGVANASDTDDDNDGFIDTVEVSALSTNPLKRFDPPYVATDNNFVIATDQVNANPHVAIWSAANGSFLADGEVQGIVDYDLTNWDWLVLNGTGVDSFYLAQQLFPLANGVKLSAGHASGDLNGNHSCVLTSEPKVRCSYGLGEPVVEKSSLVTPTDVAVGAGFACAIHNNGLIACWDYFDGNPVDPPTSYTSSVPASPSFSGGATAATAIAAGEDHVCAITNSATAPVQCWGKVAAATYLVPSALASSTPLKIDAQGSRTCVITGSYSATTAVTCWAGGTTTVSPGITITNPISVDVSDSGGCVVEKGSHLAETATKCWSVDIDHTPYD